MRVPLVEADRVSFDGRGYRVLHEISLRLSNRRTFILGPNGAGKSVLLRVLHGLLQPSRGEVRWHAAQRGGVASEPAAKAGAARPQGRPRMAMVFQRPVMLRRSALDNIIYGMAGNCDATAAEQTARDMLGRVGLTHLADRPARLLSGGEQQRVALARAWALRPHVLLLDEPTASLDPHGIRAIESIIGEIAQSGTAIVMVTHHRGVAKRLADDIVFLHQGQVAEHTPAAQFFAAPVSQPGRDYLKGDLE